MTSINNAPNVPAPRWAAVAASLASAAIGIAAAAAVHAACGGALASSTARAAADFCGLFSTRRAAKESFGLAVALSRADFAWLAIAQLFPCLSKIPARAMTASFAAARAFLFAIAASAAASVSSSASIAAVCSILCGEIAAVAVFDRIFADIGRERSAKTAFFGIIYACAWSGALIVCRFLILLACGR